MKGKLGIKCETLYILFCFGCNCGCNLRLVGIHLPPHLIDANKCLFVYHRVMITHECCNSMILT